MVASKDPQRRERILSVLAQMPLEDALTREQFLADLKAEAAATDPRDPDAIVTPRVLEDYLALAPQWRTRKATAMLAARGARVIVVPGFMGSALRDISGGHGLIWVDPTLAINGSEIKALALAPYQAGQADRDASANVTVQASGCVPLCYDLLGWFLWMNGYSVSYAPYDWRKHLDESAQRLAQTIRDHFVQSATPVRVIAHSQGSLVARRALQLLGASDAMHMVQMLVLLGPATFGTYTAALALSGNHSQIETFRRWAINAPADVEQVFQSMSGLYQLIPWKKDLQESVEQLRQPSFWKTGIDSRRLEELYGWSNTIDARFFNDRTRVILGDAKTVSAVAFQNGKMVATAETNAGDGTVPDLFAKIPGVLSYKAPEATHSLLAANFTVCRAVIRLLGGSAPKITRQPLTLAAAPPEDDATPVFTLADDRPRPVSPAAARRDLTAAKTAPAASVSASSSFGVLPPEPTCRRLRVFALDPMLSSSLETAEYSELTIELNWNDVGTQPAPVGEYLEVVDVDPQSGRYYPPVDLNHPHLLAQDGLAPSEKNPQFHQQMTFAVAMSTIRIFEKSLGRVALWSPRLVRDDQGDVVRSESPDAEYVPRLRIYPHAMRQRNAFYDPERKALLFGYFPSDGALGARVQRGGNVFTATSLDIIAHETTHALLDGLHRYLIYPSNPDVLAFHEGFADIVALLQRFSHAEFLEAQIAKGGGDLAGESLLGQLAGQFATASGGKGNGLRQYLGQYNAAGEWERVEPDPDLITKLTEAHDRGAILVAAVFQALINIYNERSEDLFRIAGVGRRQELDLEGYPELVQRLAHEAATSAAHLLRMCVRALDYLPPVDLTLGEYLQALITADYDLVRNDDRRYRISVVDAFARWGVYPSEAATLLEGDLLWQPPEGNPLPNLIKWIEGERRAERFADWIIGADRQRAFRSRSELGISLHQWLTKNAPPDGGKSLGLALDPATSPQSIRRDRNGRPVFEVHSVRPCSRIGPDGQNLQDLVIEIVQKRKACLNDGEQKRLDSGLLAYDDAPTAFDFRGGCTLIVDGRSGAIRYVIRKRIDNDVRLAVEREFRNNPLGFSRAMTYFERDETSPFRLLHEEVR